MVMKTRSLGYTDLELTPIGLGTWAMGGPWEYGWGSADDDQGIRTVLAALETGINWIDTAPIYGLGHSEELIGQALKQTSLKPLIVDKCGLVWDQDGREVNCLTSKSVRKQCCQSLKSLGVEVIDLYLMHWPKPEEDIEQGWEEMVRLKEEGKVRYIGVSNFDVAQIERVRKLHPVAALQSRYNMLIRTIEDKLLGYCSENDIGVMAWSPMERGLLTGKFSYQRMKDLPADDHRKEGPDFQEPKLGATLELVEGLREIAERDGQTCARLAVSWVLRRKEITGAIVGARRPEQITETAGAGEWDLSSEDLASIEQLLIRRDKEIEAKSLGKTNSN